MRSLGGFVHRRLFGRMSSPSSSLGDPRRWDGPDLHGHLRFWRPPGCWLPTPPLGTASASRTRVSRATTSRPGRWTIAVIGLRRRELHPVLQLMRLGCFGYTTPQWRDWRSTGSAGRWGESNSQRRVYWTRARPILASAAGSRNAGISTEKIRGEPRLLYIPLGHHVRWCRLRRAVVGSVRLTGPSREPRF